MAAAWRCPLQRRTRSRSGVFPISSSLPYFVALELGYFKELNIRAGNHQSSWAARRMSRRMITNQIEVSAVLVTLEGLNADLKKPGVAMYIAMHSQNTDYKMEQFVVRNGCHKVKSLADLKGKKLMSAPGPANLNTAKGILAKSGSEGGRLHHRSARHGPARQRHEGRHLRRRLHARAERHHHAARSAPRKAARGRRDRQIRPGRRRRPTPMRRAAHLPPTSSRSGRMWPSDLPPPGPRRSTTSTTTRRGAQVSRQEHPDAATISSMSCRCWAISWSRT